LASSPGFNAAGNRGNAISPRSRPRIVADRNRDHVDRRHRELHPCNGRRDARNALGVWLLYRAGETFVSAFTATDWRPIGDGDLVLEIPSHAHLRGRTPRVLVQERTDAGFSDVGCDVSLREDGMAVIGARMRFDGRVLVS